MFWCKGSLPTFIFSYPISAVDPFISLSIAAGHLTGDSGEPTPSPFLHLLHQAAAAPPDNLGGEGNKVADLSKMEVNFGSQPYVYNIELENVLQEAHAKDVAQSKNDNSSEHKEKDTKTSLRIMLRAAWVWCGQSSKTLGLSITLDGKHHII